MGNGMNNRSISRPVYETELDISLEDAVAEKLCLAWGVRSSKMKKFFPADVALVSNDASGSYSSSIKAFVEIKVRSNKFLDYRTYMISLHKLIELSSLSAFTGIPCLLVVQWDGDLGYWKIPESLIEDEVALDGFGGVQIAIGGTKRRLDPQDEEPVAYIPIEKFTILDTKRKSAENYS